jgi:hypothetical protein
MQSMLPAKTGDPLTDKTGTGIALTVPAKTGDPCTDRTGTATAAKLPE